MDQSASVLLSFPPDSPLQDSETYDKAIKAHVARVSQLFKQKAAELHDQSLALLDCLNPEINSLSYLLILDLILPLDPKQAPLDPALAERIILFLHRFDARQIRYCGSAFLNVFNCAASGNVLPASVAVPLLAGALLKIDPRGIVLSSNHILLMKLAYFSGEIEPVLPVARQLAVNFPSTTTQPSTSNYTLGDPRLSPTHYVTKDTGLTTRLTSLQVLEYQWLVGLVFCSQRDWKAARQAFGRAASHPARESGVSKVMVEAYKKWVLVSLLGEGRVGATPGSTPPHTSAVAGRAFSVLGRAYVQIAEHYHSLDAEALKRHVEVSMQQFVEDGNEGLVKEALESHQKWQIISLRDVYSKIALAEINAKTKSAVTGEPLADEGELVGLVERMAASGMLKAVIEPAKEAATPEATATPACLTFLPDEAKTSESDVSREIEGMARDLAFLGELYQDSKERFSLSKEVIKHRLKEHRKDQDPSRDAPTFDASVDDEDLMSGIQGNF